MRAKGIKGYTLIELLITSSITVIIFTLGIIGSSRLTEKTAQRNAIFNITALLQQARLNAVTTGYRTLVCSLGETGACLKDWTGNEIVVVVDKNGNRKRDNDESIIYRLDWSHSKIHLDWSTNALQDASITFQPKGTVVANGTLSFVDSADKAFAKLIINTGGRVRFEKQ